MAVTHQSDSWQVLSGTVVDIPSVHKHNFFNFDELLDRVVSLDEGKALNLPLPPDVKRKPFDCLLRQASIRRGISLSIRHIGDDIYLTIRRKERKPRIRENEERNEQILSAIAAGELQTNIAARFSISHQRVQQINKRYFVTGLAPDQRREKLLEFAAPYLAVCDAKRCLTCGVETEHADICKQCKARLRKIGRVRSMLAYFKKSGDPQSIRQAVYEIRKHNIRPVEIGCEQEKE